MPSIHTFIISWPGQHANAAHIANQIGAISDQLSLVFSDPDPQLTLDCVGKQIHRPQHMFWSDKFQTCLQNLQSEYLLIIHADCTCGNWAELVAKCQSSIQQHPSIGVWAPLIRGTHYQLPSTHVADIRNTSISIAAQTDGIVFCLSPSVVNRMRKLDYHNNLYGWGIDWFFCCHAYSSGQLVTVDRSIKVDHPADIRGYPDVDAKQQMNAFLRQMTTDEIVHYHLLNSRIHSNNIRIREING